MASVLTLRSSLWALRQSAWSLSTRTMSSAAGAALSHSEPVSHTTPPPSMPARHPKMPPNYEAVTGDLETFDLPTSVSGSREDQMLGQRLIAAFRRDGILQIRIPSMQQNIVDDAFVASKAFFRQPHAEKAALVDPYSYGGYIASGEEITDGIADYSEIYTVTKDVAPTDPRFKLPCHGQQPWPNKTFKDVVNRYMKQLGNTGDIMLGLAELGLNIPRGSLTKLSQDGWHHLRVLRFPQNNKTNGKGKDGRGIGSHTDYGMLVIASQNDVGGLFIRPPYDDEKTQNWAKSAAGVKENDAGWVFVPPVSNVFTVFPGDMLQYMTNHYLPSTPHKVGLNTTERFAFAYFHEPHFDSVVKPLPGYNGGQEPTEGIHYGTHFTNMFKRNYPDRVTTQQLLKDGREVMLAQPEYRQE
ncbi:2-oxoglutarate-dependent ethylene/succinate-forming enzyme [Ceratocystis lukuohia]|uniref:2-oxoglutarate-dependent ethylene/succinate-forming enzyme n=1 Tax=Ceratocystis lukuohia TaxID=2019550 RepID=A0ABR4MHB9_9PEZI